MLKFLIVINVLMLLWLIIRLIRIQIMLKRFCRDVYIVKELNERFLNNEELYYEYESRSFILLVGEYYVEFDNFVNAVNYLEYYVQEVMMNYEKIIKMTNRYDLSEHEKILNNVIYKIKIWRWKHS